MTSVTVLILLLTTISPAIVIGMVGHSAIKAVGRNPSASSRILLAMIIAFIFAEAIAVLAILMLYLGGMID
jgi:F0F1-type ATP synthase membrane subunit c/vacuolar-type H+-ATPase subunit K